VLFDLHRLVRQVKLALANWPCMNRRRSLESRLQPAQAGTPTAPARSCTVI